MSTDKIDFVDNIFQGSELRRLRKARKETLEVFAQRLGVTDDMISKIESGKRQPGNLLAEKIERVYGLSRFVETGECSLSPTDQPDDNGGENLTIEIRYLAGAGNPRLQSDEVVATMVFPIGFMKSGIIPVMVKGSSMEPAMYNGAIAGVDITDKNVVSGKYYAIWIDDEGALIKRLSRERDRVFVESINPTAHSFHVNNEALQDHFILGRVAWWINRDTE